MTVNEHTLALAAGEAARALRYGWQPAPHQPTIPEMLAWDDNAPSPIPITPQPDTSRCPHCAGTGRVRQEP